PRLSSRSSILVLFTVASSEAISLGDISIRDSRGHYHPGTTVKNAPGSQIEFAAASLPRHVAA
ncbi:MAG: hypothetical protein ABSH52_28500, partial [Terriglobia bacterium]